MNKIDLQIQSTASDGKYSPVELVDMAKKNGLHTIAITDHDTVGGVKEALARALMTGLRVIPGIEMSVSLENKELHILGYSIDIDNENLLRRLAHFQDDRVRRMQRIVENLQKIGFKISFEDVQKQAKGSMARPHVAMAVMANPENKELLGEINSVHDFIENYIVPGKPGYAEREYVSSVEAISLIHEAGGIAIWSHPAIHFAENPNQLETTLQKL
ncbi:MAG: PHP domain-containing protein, partial [Patescibacteria group bacterium]